MGYNQPLEQEPCNADFGKATEERFSEIEPTPGPGDYENQPNNWDGACAANFGRPSGIWVTLVSESDTTKDSGSPKTVEIWTTPGPDTYEIKDPKTEWLRTNTLGKRTQRRFKKNKKSKVGPGYYSYDYPGTFGNVRQVSQKSK